MGEATQLESEDPLGNSKRDLRIPHDMVNDEVLEWRMLEIPGKSKVSIGLVALKGG